jgi:hypothetical protein
MATVTPITRSYDLEGRMAMYQDSVLEGLDEVHDEASPAVKISWDNRITKNFTNDTVFSMIKYQLAPGGMMPRRHTFTLDNIDGPLQAQFTAKICEAHTSIDWFDRQEAMSDDALYDIVADNISTCWETLWKRLSYMFWSKQRETVPGSGVIDANTIYTTMLPDVTIQTIGQDASTMFDGLPLASRGNKETTTYGGLTVTAGSTDNSFWQAKVRNTSFDDHTTDDNIDGTGESISTSILNDHIGSYSFGGKRPAYGSMPYQVWDSFQSMVHSLALHPLNQPVTLNAFGIEDSIKYRGTEYYSEPWCTDMHYDSTIGGSIFEWGPDRFQLLLHSSSENPVLISDIGQGSNMQGFQHLERSTIFFFGLFLWGNFICKKRHRIGRMNNLL